MGAKERFKIQTYNIGIVKKPIHSIVESGIKKGDIIWLKHNLKDRFFADPFLWREDEEKYYILVEEYIFWEEKGKISLLTISKDDFELIEKKVVIEEDYHLSFPFCEKNGNTIIPESVRGGETYKYVLNADNEIVSKEKILNEGLVDAICYKDYILTCRKTNPKSDLYIYKKTDKGYVLLQNEPYVSDFRYARSAGRIFNIGEKIFRPVQDSTVRYGEQTRIVRLNELTDKVYDTIEVQIVNSFENPPFDETLHTFNVYDDCVIVDGSKDYLRFPMKILYKKFRWIFKNRT